MIAAIYARKSTDQSGVADEAKSVTRQIAHAREYAARKGWMVDDGCLFVDDGISGAEFANRPGFVRLMNALKPRPAFQILIMSEESRLGREAIETAYALKQIITAGVRVFFYLEDRERTLDSPTDKIMMSLTAFADELEREKARQRVTDTMVQKARAGYVTGGRVFGYENLEVLGPDGRRSHVDRRILPTKAAIVTRIFEMCAAGTGYTRIAKSLNAERAPSPRPQQARPAGWAPSSVREILHRELYRGVIIWNKTRKRDRWGQHRQTDRPESEWMRRQAPELRIVPDVLWNAVQSRITGIRDHLAAVSNGRAGVRHRDIESKYLLPGFARCASCGGTFCIMTRKYGTRRAAFYGCLAHYKRGATVCANGLTLPMERIDEAVLSTLAGDVLKPAIVDAVIAGVLTALEPAAVSRQATIDREIARLTEAVATATTPVSTLLKALQARQQRRDTLAATIGADAPDVTRIDRRAIVAAAREKLTAWRSLLTRQVPDGRELLRQVLVGPLRFTPDGKRYRFEGRAALGQLLTGAITPFVASPPGFVPARVERERDAACLKAGGGRHRPSEARKMASPPGTVWKWMPTGALMTAVSGFIASRRGAA
jgi:DNA invertase Pin-like site-specific DNA recombinase